VVAVVVAVGVVVVAVGVVVVAVGVVVVAVGVVVVAVGVVVQPRVPVGEVPVEAVSEPDEEPPVEVVGVLPAGQAMGVVKPGADPKNATRSVEMLAGWPSVT
jgi:hypothetical protein